MYAQKCPTMEFSLRGKTSFAVICFVDYGGVKNENPSLGEKNKKELKRIPANRTDLPRGGGVVLKKEGATPPPFPNVLRVRKGLLFFTNAREKLKSGKEKRDFETSIRESHRKEISEVFDLGVKGVLGVVRRRRYFQIVVRLRFP